MGTSNIFFNFLILFTVLPLAISQSTAAAPSPASSSCNGIFLSYLHTKSTQIPPDISKSDPTHQPYRFESTLTVTNNGLEELKSWMAFVGFQHGEYLVSASSAVLADGSSFPIGVGNGTVFAGYPNADLMTAIETAGDLTQMEAVVKLVGTQFGVQPPAVPMPSNISLANDGFLCPAPTFQGKSLMQVCCTKDANFKSNVTLGENFLPRQDGDLTIMYDVTKTYDMSYLAQVTISNHNPLGRLDNWQLSWDWMKEEFIFAMKGAYPDVIDTSDCIYGAQGQYYKNFDFSTALNCQKRPTIIDLPPTMANDSNLGLIPFCCRNGTILPREMDPSKSSSVFQINVYKTPPDNNRSVLSPPQNWAISGSLNPVYQCGPPVRVSPSQFADTSGLSSTTAAVASWQVVCNITQQKGASPRCCVSFSAYYNDSIVPCNTCACGCPSSTSQKCSTIAPAILLPSEALLVPFENRSALTLAWAALKHRSVPNPLPCADNCGVSINWHLYTDYTKGWSARMTIFNWEDSSFADWFAAVELDKAGPGFEKVYSFNGSALAAVNNTIFMQGLKDFNYLVGETDGTNPAKDPRVPGKQQSVISFTKKNTPGINIPGRDGFPSKVFFNGEECSLPSLIPTSNAHSFKASTRIYSIILAVLVFLLMQR